jgi:hypothetical protein
MAQLHLVLAYRGRDRADRPHVCYCGHDADAAGTAVSGALSGGMFARVERYRPGSPLVKHADVAPVEDAPAEELPVEDAPKKKAKKKTAPDPPVEDEQI